MDNWIEFLVHLAVDSTVCFDVAPAESAHYISMAHRPCGAWDVNNSGHSGPSFFWYDNHSGH